MKKIVLILQTKPQDGGQHQYAETAVSCLLEKAAGKYELVAVCATPFWRKWCKERGIRRLEDPFPRISKAEQQFNCRHPFLAGLYYTYMTPFGKKLREEKADVLFSLQQHTFLPHYRVRIVSPVHDLMHKYEPDFPEVKSDFENRELCMKSMARYASCLLVDSRLGKKQFEESYKKAWQKKPYVVSIPFTVPPHVWKQEEEYIDVPKKYIFYPAQFWKHKNHMNLVKAVKIAKETVNDIHLVLVGSEKNNCFNVKKYIAENGLEENVTILGFVSDGNITYLYKHAVAMVMPSYFGPTNIPPLEAMALGCPVAVSDKYAMGEQVGEAGLLFDPDNPKEIADCIKRLWLDEDLRKKCITLGYKRAIRFSQKEFGRRLCKVMDFI